MKHCIITGAADGIGRALAQTYAHAGYAVTGIDVNEALAEQTHTELTAKSAQVEFIIANLAEPAGIEHTIEQLASGPDIDILIHNAGINAVARFETSSLEAQQRVIAINLLAPQLLTAALLNRNKLVNGSSLVFVSSLSHYVSYPGAAVYAATKDGLASYARSLSVSLAGQNIHVLTVFPGPTRTDHARRHSPDNSREHKRMPPDVLAEHIFKAAAHRQRHLIPGLGNRLFALVGRYFPAVTHFAMRKLILDKLNPPG